MHVIVVVNWKRVAFFDNTRNTRSFGADTESNRIRVQVIVCCFSGNISENFSLFGIPVLVENLILRVLVFLKFNRI